jgi:hypothetical protein
VSVNRYQPHVFVLPEDDANGQLATGFLLDHSLRTRKIQVLPEVGGWTEVLDHFNSEHVAQMDRFPGRRMILLIDFDGNTNRVNQAKAAIPPRLASRVFILGTLTEPEDLKTDLGTYETIGQDMAKDCREGTDTTWGHALLRHNESELNRMRPDILPILF